MFVRTSSPNVDYPRKVRVSVTLSTTPGNKPLDDRNTRRPRRAPPFSFVSFRRPGGLADGLVHGCSRVTVHVLLSSVSSASDVRE